MSVFLPSIHPPTHLFSLYQKFTEPFNNIYNKREEKTTRNKLGPSENKPEKDIKASETWMIQRASSPLSVTSFLSGRISQVCLFHLRWMNRTKHPTHQVLVCGYRKTQENLTLAECKVFSWPGLNKWCAVLCSLLHHHTKHP